MNARTPGLEPPVVAPAPERPLRALLVEDDPVAATLVGRMLQEAAPGAIALTHLGTLREAVERPPADPSDIVLLDLNLPDCEGLATYEALRRQRCV